MPFPAAPFGPVAGAVVLALLSTLGYASSAVLQEREARRTDPDASGRARPLLRRLWWWVALGATAAGAGLHIAALVWGPLSFVQPLGVLTLVLALPLGARLNGRIVTRREWAAAAAVAGGLAAVLSIAPHGAPPPHLSSTAILSTAAVVTVLAVDRAGGLGALGLLATAAGIGALTRPHPPRGIVTATPAAEEFEVAHVVR